MIKSSKKFLVAGDVVAVYGTLRMNQPNYFRLNFPEHTKYLGKGIIKGKLYDVANGGFPGFVPDEDGEVVVDLFSLSTMKIGNDIDGLEGYNPDSSDNRFYRRVFVPINNFEPSEDFPDAEGTMVHRYETLGAYTYVFVTAEDNPNSPRCVPIPSGDWVGYTS